MFAGTRSASEVALHTLPISARKCNSRLNCPTILNFVVDDAKIYLVSRDVTMYDTAK